MDSVIRTGLDGMQRGLSAASDASVRIVDSFRPESTESETNALLDLSLASLQVRASAKIVQTGDSLQGLLLDLLA